MVVEVLISPLLPQCKSYQDLMQKLEHQSNQNRTAKCWVENLIKPMLLIMLFVRAEKEGNFLLHLYACKKMMPYFFAADHFHYARYGYWVLLHLVNVQYA